MNSVISYYTTRFGELWNKSLYDLANEAFEGVLKNGNLCKDDIDAIFVGNMLSGVVEGRLLLASYLSELFNINCPIYRVEAACASGGLAFQLANEYLKSNKDKTVLVLGVEKMTDVNGALITKGLATAASDDEQKVGLTFPGVYALMAMYYLSKYGYDEKHLAAVSVKNHAHATFNQDAHFRRSVSIDNVLESTYIAYPLKVLDSSPISDGAAALLITNKKELVNKSKSAPILSSETATDTISVAKRKNIDSLQATVIASQKAMKAAKLKHDDINIMEVHDCFTIAEILALEDLGFWEKGKGGALAKDMVTHRDSGNNLIVNTSGGLKAAGHPVGGTGVKQIGEIYLQLTNQAGTRQVKSLNKGLAHNVGGSGGVSVVTILGN
jgi:acetyl-CoA C-acetyltransferase